MFRWLVVSALLGLACTGCPPPPPVPDGGAYAHCLDSPSATPPNGELPCELLPPGFKR